MRSAKRMRADAYANPALHVPAHSEDVEVKYGLPRRDRPTKSNTRPKNRGDRHEMVAVRACCTLSQQDCRASLKPCARLRASHTNCNGDYRARCV